MSVVVARFYSDDFHWVLGAVCVRALVKLFRPLVIVLSRTIWRVVIGFILPLSFFVIRWTRWTRWTSCAYRRSAKPARGWLGRLLPLKIGWPSSPSLAFTGVKRRAATGNWLLLPGKGWFGVLNNTREVVKQVQLLLLLSSVCRRWRLQTEIHRFGRPFTGHKWGLVFLGCKNVSSTQTKMRKMLAHGNKGTKEDCKEC